MKTNVLLKIPLGGLITALIILLGGCGGSQQGIGLDEGENLAAESGEFGELVTTDQDDTSGLQSEEDEVLRLLGISREQKPPSAPVEKSDTLTDAPREVNTLRDELSDRENEISALRADLDSKQNRIDELETRLKQQAEQPAIPGFQPLSPIDKSTYKTRYQEALRLYNDRQYQEAISVFEGLLANDMSHSLADNAQYWIGECYYGMGNYNQAVVEFEKVFSFTGKDKFDDALLKIGLCYMRLGERNKAKLEFERLISDYPNSEYIGKAESYLSKL